MVARLASTPCTRFSPRLTYVSDLPSSLITLLSQLQAPLRAPLSLLNGNSPLLRVRFLNSPLLPITNPDEPSNATRFITRHIITHSHSSLSATQPHTFDDPAQPQAPAPNQVAPQLSDPSSFHGPGHIEYDDPPTVPEILPTANDLISALLTIPTFLYYLLFLFLPFFYHARVNQIYSGVSLTEHEIASRYVGGPPTGFWRPKYWEEVKRSWADFIDSSIKEWNTLNIVSVLLLGCVRFNLVSTAKKLRRSTARFTTSSNSAALVHPSYNAPRSCPLLAHS